MRPWGRRAAPTRLLGPPKLARANRVGVSDITYLRFPNSNWARLCAFQSAYTKHVVGWHMAATVPEESGTTALQRTFFAQLPTPSLLVRSDRGGRYCGNAHRARLHRHGAVRSQSRRGGCHDNAQAKSRGWPVFTDPADAQIGIADYFDHYNHDRLHAGIGYQTPHHAPQQSFQTTALNYQA